VSGPLAGLAVVHFGDAEPTLRCLKAVLDDPSAVERRVAVVDNLGNLDPASCPRGVEVLPRPDNPGFGSAVNFGLGTLDPDNSCTLYVALNNDTIILAEFLDAAAQALEVGVGAAGGPVCDTGRGCELWYAGGSVNFVTGTVRQQRSRAAARRRRDVGYIPATAMALSPIAWREVGGFDPRYFLYNEDLDLCLRLRRAGWRLRFEPEMRCEHSLGSSTGSSARSPLYLENLTRTRLLPFASRPYRVYLALIHTVYNALRVVGIGVRHGTGGRPYAAAVARGHLAALRSVMR
jgi:GT2 family glycosyltransferase